VELLTDGLAHARHGRLRQGRLGTERVRQRRLDVAHAQAADEEKPSYYLAWIQAESAHVGEQYARLIAEARRVAGRAMHDGWNDPPRATDPEMNIPREVIDLGQLATVEAEYMQAVRQHLSSLTHHGGLDSGG
jgi:hypothetical protein